MEFIENIGAWIIPFLLVLLGTAFMSDKRMFDEFVIGAENGLKTSIKLLPTLILLMIGINMLLSCGITDALVEMFSPLCRRIGLPEKILPLIILRPFSGSASLAMANDIFTRYSPDSQIGLITSVIMGSSDTLLYVNAVYFSQTGVKHTRHALPCSILTMIFCIFVSCFVCGIFFS